MIVARSIKALREARAAMGGSSVGFVPTMGYLHEGHLSLVDEARRRADAVVASIFVNPLQFGPEEDLDRYPRDEQGDIEKLRRRGVALLFMPSLEELYPAGFVTQVRVGGSLGRRLCGATRPGHFDGVATVVTRLFGLIRPQLAVFGSKDYQQLQIIRRLSADLALAAEIVGAPTVREPDGLAMSSRNANLSPEERREALALQRALKAGRAMIEQGERHPARVSEQMQAVLAAPAAVVPVYAEALDAVNLEPLTSLRGEILLAVAAHVGCTRLIDNTTVLVDEKQR